MPITTTISYNHEAGDYVVGGRLLLAHLQVHEGVDTSMYQTAISARDEAMERLLLKREPDLTEGHTALYLCAMCGGYDASPIGARIFRKADRVVWEDIGYYDDLGELTVPYKKIRRYEFDWDEYEQALARHPR